MNPQATRRAERQARVDDAVKAVAESGTEGVLRDVLMQMIGLKNRRSFQQLVYRLRSIDNVDIRPGFRVDGLRYFIGDNVFVESSSVKPFVIRAMAEKLPLIVAAGRNGATSEEVKGNTGWATYHMALAELKRTGQVFFRRGNQTMPGRYFAKAEWMKADEKARPPARVVSAKKKAAPVPLVLAKAMKAPPPSAFATAEAIIPPGLKVQVIPHGVDTRFQVTIPPGGGAITRDWIERRQAA